jgi:hypothetical protein
MEQLSPSERLKAMLSGLCSSKEDYDILQNLCDDVVSFEDKRINFSDFEIEFNQNFDIVPSEDLPKSFAEILNVASTFVWDGGGPEVGFEINKNGFSTADGWLYDELEEDDNPGLKERLDAAGGPKDAFIGGQNALFFDPTRKLSNGEPALAFMSHEDAEWVEVKSVDHLNYKQIFLRMISDAVLDTQFIGEIYF